MSESWIRGELEEAWGKWEDALVEVKEEVNQWLDQVGPLPQTEEEVKKNLWVLEGLISSLGRLRDLSRSLLAELLLIRFTNQGSPLPSEGKEFQGEELPFMH